MTPREQEVWTHLSKGLTNTQIGTQLGIEEKTVKAHVTSILKQLGVSNRTQAAIEFARRQSASTPA